MRPREGGAPQRRGGEAREAELAESSGRKSRGERPRLKRGLDLLLCAKRGQDKEGRASPAFLEDLRRERRGPRSGPASGGDRGAEAGGREAPKGEKDTP